MIWETCVQLLFPAFIPISDNFRVMGDEQLVLFSACVPISDLLLGYIDRRRTISCHFRHVFQLLTMSFDVDTAVLTVWFHFSVLYSGKRKIAEIVHFATWNLNFVTRRNRGFTLLTWNIFCHDFFHVVKMGPHLVVSRATPFGGPSILHWGQSSIHILQVLNSVSVDSIQNRETYI